MNYACEVNVAGPEEDCGRHVAYVPCRKPAVAEARSPYAAREFYVCEEHAREIDDGTGPESVYHFDEEPRS